MSKNTVELSFDELQVLRAVLYEYYSENDYMCEVEMKSHESLEQKLSTLEDQFEYAD
jgi:hypothetical protein